MPAHGKVRRRRARARAARRRRRRRLRLLCRGASARGGRALQRADGSRPPSSSFVLLLPPPPLPARALSSVAPRVDASPVRARGLDVHVPSPSPRLRSAWLRIALVRPPMLWYAHATRPSAARVVMTILPPSSLPRTLGRRRAATARAALAASSDLPSARADRRGPISGGRALPSIVVASPSIGTGFVVVARRVGVCGLIRRTQGNLRCHARNAFSRRAPTTHADRARARLGLGAVRAAAWTTDRARCLLAVQIRNGRLAARSRRLLRRHERLDLTE